MIIKFMELLGDHLVSIQAELMVLISQYTPDNQLILHYSDLLDSASMSTLINKIQPDEVYNLAAQSHVAVSFKTPVFSSQTSTLGPLSLLEPLRKLDKKVKFYQASSSEMYGGATEDKLDEKANLIQKVLMLQLKFLLIIYQKFIENPMICFV